MNINKNRIWQDVVWIVIYMSLFFQPPLLSRFLVIDVENTENRALAKKPELSIESIDSFSDAFTQYYEDNLPFKQQMVFLYDSIIYKCLKDSNVASVVTGKDGWLFYNSEVKNDGNTITEYKRIKQYTDEDLVEFADNINELSDYITGLDKKFVLLIIPNKEEIYAQYMPSEIKVLENTASCDVLVDYLRENTNATVIYPKDELMRKASENQDVRIYQKLDTHWNSLGAAVATQVLEEELMGYCKTPDTSYKVIDYSNVDGLSQMLNVAPILEPEEQYIVPEYQRDDKSIIYNDERFDVKLLICGDSFRIGLEPFLAADFMGMEEAHRGLLEDNQIMNSDADVVILEFVERYVDQLKTYSFYGDQ